MAFLGKIKGGRPKKCKSADKYKGIYPPKCKPDLEAPGYREMRKALANLVAETERCDNPELMGVGRDEPVMVAARAALDKAGT